MPARFPATEQRTRGAGWRCPLTRSVLGQELSEPAPGPDVECADGLITRAPGGCSGHGGVASRVRKR